MIDRNIFTRARRASRHLYPIVLGLAYAAAAATIYWRVVADGSI